MNGPRERIIAELHRVGRNGILQAELQKLTGCSRSYLSEVLADLEEKGLILRVHGEGNSRRVISLMNPGGTRYFRIGLLRSSEYIPLIASLKTIFEDSTSLLDVAFSNNPNELYDDLLSGRMDAICAPLISLGTNFMVRRGGRLMFGIASGGSYTYENEQYASDGILTSENSTMSLLASKISASGKWLMHSYMDPATGTRDFIGGKFRFISIWEPYATKLLDLGYRPINHYADALSNQPCCGLMISEQLDKSVAHRLLETLNKEYSDFDQNKINMTWAIRLFADTIGFTPELIERSMRSYSFHLYTISMDTFKTVGINMTEELFLKLTSFP